MPLSVAPGTTAPAEASTGAADPQCPWSGTFFVNKVLLKQTASAHLHVAYSHLSPDETLLQRPRGSRSLKCSRPGVFPEQAYQPPIWETVGNAETEAPPQAPQRNLHRTLRCPHADQVREARTLGKPPRAQRSEAHRLAGLCVCQVSTRENSQKGVDVIETDTEEPADKLWALARRVRTLGTGRRGDFPPKAEFLLPQATVSSTLKPSPRTKSEPLPSAGPVAGLRSQLGVDFNRICN